MASGTIKNMNYGNFFDGHGTEQGLIYQVTWQSAGADQSFTASQDGWLVALVQNKDATGGALLSNGVVVSVNDIPVMNVVNNTGWGASSICVPVKKGASIKFSPKTGDWTAIVKIWPM